VVRQGTDNILLAAPGRNQAGPEMVVARTKGHSDGFLLFVPEPGWKLMRRHFGNRALGHVYLYRETWPGQEAALPDAALPAAGTTAPGAAVPVTPATPGPTPPAGKPSAALVPPPALPGTGARP
jgi:hypothetical protein